MKIKIDEILKMTASNEVKRNLIICDINDMIIDKAKDVHGKILSSAFNEIISLYIKR